MPVKQARGEQKKSGGGASLFGLWQRMFDVTAGSMAALGRVQQANMNAAMAGFRLAANTYSRMWGGQPDDVLPADKRFAAEAWQRNPAYHTLREAYQVYSKWLADLAASAAEIDPALGRRAAFYTGQFTDALSPTNFPATNPEVLEEAFRTGGASLAQGAQNLLHDLRQGRLTQVAGDAFVVGRDLAATPGKVVYRNQLIELIQYAPATAQAYSTPLLVIPPWVNKYYVMDLTPANSLFRYLVAAGFTVFCISWKNPRGEGRGLDFDDYVTLGPLAALDAVKSITGAEQVNAAGYCLGGILLESTLAYMAATGHDSIRSATFFASHQDFSDAGDLLVFISDPEVRFLEWLMDLSGGYLDSRNMAATFNTMRANDLLWHYVVNNYLLGRQPPEMDLLFWNNDGTRVPETVHSYVLREFFLKNGFMHGGITVKGVPIDTRQIKMPVYAVVGSEDHIVPWRGMFKLRELVSGPVRFVLGESGHIAGIINPPAAKKRAYWTNDDAAAEADRDPEAWLAGATKHPGSWWVDWVPWLAERSGELAAPPKMGNEKYPAVADAPGTYVLEK